MCVLTFRSPKALRVGQDFVELQEPAMLAASAFQMKIVNHQRLAAVVEFSDQRNPSALTPLKDRERGDHERIGFPETGLMRESQDARRADRHGGERGLPVIR